MWRDPAVLTEGNVRNVVGIGVRQRMLNLRIGLRIRRDDV